MQAHVTDGDQAALDLGPLAWVLDELRKSLDAASAALRRYVRDTGLARGSDMASVDDAQLRIARQQLHQAVGALEMVGLPAPAHVLRSMEAAVQRFTERPELCSEAAAAKVERAGFALTQYLGAVLVGKPASPIALFPQYRDTQELSGSDRVHPADLWEMDFRWIEPELPQAQEAVSYEPALRSRMDQAVLRLVRSGDAAAGSELARLCLSLAAGAVDRQPRIFWKISAAFFEALALGLLPADVYVKRAGSRVLMQYASLAKGDATVSDRLAQDLLFFCGQAVAPANAQAPLLAGVRRAWGLTQAAPVDYQTPLYGRFDPLVQAQARKRLGAAKETWSAVAGGDANKLRGLPEQFHGLCESLLKLYPESAPLANALNAAVDTVVRGGKPPGPELAMEVATAVLYLEAGLDELGPADMQLAPRTARLAERLDHVRVGGKSEPLEPWIEELYGRVSDRQTMGSVVGELRGTLGELEKVLDAFFRKPTDRVSLQAAPGHLSQMRGVLSVLGLDQAAQAVLRMREQVEQILVGEGDGSEAQAGGTYDRLGNNLGALGFLIDMLNYQPALAKKLFVYDDMLGELKPLMGRSVVNAPPAEVQQAEPAFSAEALSVINQAQGGGQAEALSARLDTLAMQAILADQTGLAQTAREAAAAVAGSDEGAATAALNTLAEAVQAAAPVAPPAAPPAGDFEEDDLQDIFLEEAREVVQTGEAALAALAENPRDVAELTTLRRAFHTLKGSSRMVGLTEFGDAGWSFEQVLNTWLADQKPATDDLRALCHDAFRAFALWVDDIAARQDASWKAEGFREAADAMRTEQRLVALVLPARAPEQAGPAVDAAAETGPAATLPSGEQVAMADAPTPGEGGSAAEAAEEFIDLGDVWDEPQGPATTAADALTPMSDPLDFRALVDAVDEAHALDLDLSDPVPAQPAIEVVEGLAGAGNSLVGIDAPAQEPTPLTAQSDELDTAPAGLSLEVDFELPDERPAPLATHESQGEVAARPAPENQPDIAVETAVAQRDAGLLAVAAPAPVQPEPVDTEPVDTEPVDTGLVDTEPAALAEADGVVLEGAAPVPSLAAAASDASDEQVKVIGHLRLGIPLYNVYLNEADEWSRRLLTEVSEWSLELNQRLPDSTVGLAHALAGASATVGFQALSDIARTLEGALLHAQGLACGTAQHGRTFTAAAEEIRRLLHQFAAGFLKHPDDSIVPALLALDDLEGAEYLEPVTGMEVRFDAPAPADDDVITVRGDLDAPSFEEDAAAGPVQPASTPEPAVIPSFAQPLAPPTPAPVVPAAQRVNADDEDEEQLDSVDAIDFELFPIFEEEAAELMPQLGGALRQWVARPDNRSARDEVLRALHTLKGSARLAGALRLGELAHHLESEIEQIGSEAVNAADLEPLLHRYDKLQANFDQLRVQASTPAAADLEASAAAQAASALRAAAEVSAHRAAPSASAAGSPDASTGAPDAPVAPLARALALPAAMLLAPQRAAANHAVRVRSQLLDRLVNQAGEVMITRSRLEAELVQLRSSLTDLTGNLDRLRTQLRDIEVQAESQMQSRLAQAKDSAANFDPLEFDRFTRVQELTRMMAESVNDVATVQRNLQRTVEATQDGLIAQARQTRELQRDLLRTRMVEFEGISDRLYRVVRLASKETGKQVRLDITGGSIEMDRGVLDRMTPAFEHLLRNCVAHGIEEPAVRTAAGKEPAGTIVINLSHEGNDVSVEFRDDGAGLDLARIRQKALQQGLTTADQVLDDREAANLIFMPGFSTATAVTELAGRGIGMDVVRSEVNALGGRIETSTEAGRGTSFKLVLPLTTAVTQVVMVRTGNLSIGIPANVVETVLRVPTEAVQQAYACGSYEVGGEQLPFYWSGALLQASQRSAEATARALTVVVFRSAAQRIAVHVDQVLGNQEAVVKNLGPQLARLPGLAGMTVLASGAVVLIYNPVALTAVYGEQARRLSAPEAQSAAAEAGGGTVDRVRSTAPAVPEIPLVLVVDDSITVRRVTQRLLQREGYRVSMAADGLQALARLAEERPAVILSDIEMPRMDGFDLARNIRSDAKLAGLPIIMITSRIAAKHREHAMALGVNHYLGKPYSDEELLSLVRHYCSSAIEA